MRPTSFARLAALALACFSLFPLTAAAYQQHHPGIAVEWVANADGEVSDAALGDADGDGFPDLFVLSDQRLQLWRNDGNGVFAVPNASICPLPLASLAVADVDHDGHLDVLGAPAGAAGLAFIRGLGGGQFADPVVWPMNGVAYRELVVLDAGGQELVATLESPGSGFDLLRRDGDLFVVHVHALEGEDLWAPAVTDVNGDAVGDLIVSAPGQAVEVMLRSGDTFERGASLAGLPSIPALASPDLDGDGDQDIVASDEESVQLHFNQGDGRQWSTIPVSRPFVDYRRGIVAADFDQDGRDELMMGVRWSNGASFITEYQCVDDPMLQNPAWFSYMFWEWRTMAPDALLSGDVNGDGRPDLVAINRFGASVPSGSGHYRGLVGSILTRPNGRPGAIRMLAGNSGATTARFHSGGASDVLLFRPEGLAVAKFGPDGTIGPTQPIGEGIGAAVLDLNRDGHDDLVATLGDGDLEVRLTGADGVPDETTANLSGALVSSGDLDHDGRPELLLQGSDGRLSVAWNDPHARFRRITSLPIGAPSQWQRQIRYAIADVDGDERGELVELIHHYLHSGPDGSVDSVQTYRVMPSGHIRALRLSVLTDLIPPDHSVDGILAGDLDGRAGQDIVLSSHYAINDGSRLHALLAQSDGSFAAGTDARLFGEGPGPLLMADIDGDGDTDVVGGASIGGHMGMLHIFWNDGTGDLSEVWSRRLAGVGRVAASAGDLDGDGAADLLLNTSAFQGPHDRNGQIGTLYGKGRNGHARATQSTAPRLRASTPAGPLRVVAITPNPARGTFDVRWSADQGSPITLELIDLAGRRVRSIGAAAAAEGRTTFSRLAALSPGVYWVRLRQGELACIRRIALVR